MPPSYSDYQESIHGYDYYFTDEQKAADQAERRLLEEQWEEERLKKAWADNTFPITLETYFENLEIAHKRQLDTNRNQITYMTKKSETQASEIMELKNQIAWLGKNEHKQELISKRRKQTLTRRIKKLLNEFAYVETDTEEE
jgi:predicted small metal-binding protein